MNKHRNVYSTCSGMDRAWNMGTIGCIYFGAGGWRSGVFIARRLRRVNAIHGRVKGIRRRLVMETTKRDPGSSRAGRSSHSLALTLSN